jgi:hypothetical protein
MAHSFFYYAHDDLEASSKKVPLKKRIQKYFKNKKKKEDWHDTHVCEFSLHTRHDRETFFLNCLPTNIQSSHTHVFKKAGFNIMTFNSSMLSFDHFCNHEKDLLIFIAKDTMRVLEFISGMYVSRKTFSASYLQFIQDIQKHLNIDSDAAKDILMQHGLLRSHKDQKVYKQLIRSLSPLVKFMTQRKAKRGEHISVVFEDYQIPGFIDLIKKNFKVPVSHLDVLNNESYPFQEILSIHKNETYPYQAHIAQALKNWRS